jgi:hypothetical protein
MMKFKKNFIIIFLIFLTQFLFCNIVIKFVYSYSGVDYQILSLTDKKEIPIEAFNALKILGQSQTHRILLTSLEKSRLSSLFYVGDHYEFNDVELYLDNINHFHTFLSNLNFSYATMRIEG